jgi:ABC-2 type transport system ATP-binding protein
MAKENIITVKHLSKSFRSRGNKNIFTGLWRPEWNEVMAVDNANFTIDRGELVAFLGPNGAGKTTTTKMLTGIMYPSGGTIRVLDHEPQRREPAFLKRIGLVMGNKTGLNWDLTAQQSYYLLKEIYEIPDEVFSEQLQTLTSLLGIESVLDRQVRQLSLGERMKAELAAALLHDPEILFLDEPTIGLDIDAKFAVREFLVELHKRKGVTIILTSHDMDDIEHVCRRVLVINKGQLIFDDSLQKLNNRYTRWRYIRLWFEGDIDTAKLEVHGAILHRDGYSYLLKVDKSELVKAVADFGAMPQLADINIESVPLEKIVSDLFKEG